MPKSSKKAKYLAKLVVKIQNFFLLYWADININIQALHTDREIIFRGISSSIQYKAKCTFDAFDC